MRDRERSSTGKRIAYAKPWDPGKTHTGKELKKKKKALDGWEVSEEMQTDLWKDRNLEPDGKEKLRVRFSFIKVTSSVVGRIDWEGDTERATSGGGQRWKMRHCHPGQGFDK